MGLADFAAGDAAGLFEVLDAVTASFLGAALAGALATGLAVVAAIGLPAFSAAVRAPEGRAGLAEVEAEAEDGDRGADGFSSARALSVLPKPRPII